MSEVIKLIEYAELGGFHLYIENGELKVSNASKLTPHLYELLGMYKEEIMSVIEKWSAIKTWQLEGEMLNNG